MRTFFFLILTLQAMDANAAVLSETHKLFDLELQRLARLSAMAYEPIELIGAPVSGFDNCEPYTTIHYLCDFPRKTLVSSNVIPAEYWNTETRFNIISNIRGFEESAPFQLFINENSCSLPGTGSQTTKNCFLGSRPGADAQGNVRLDVYLLSPDWHEISGKYRISTDASATIERLSLIPHPDTVIEKVRVLGNSLIHDVENSLDSYYRYKLSFDAAEYDKSLLTVIYKNLTETPSEVGAFSPIGSKPLVGFPNNEFNKADGTKASNSKGETKGLCGMPYTGHKVAHCQSLLNISSILCPEGKKVIVDPVTLAVTQTCLGVQGQVREEWKQGIDSYRKEIDSGLELIGRLEAVQATLSDQIVNVRVNQVSNEAATYGRAYKIFRAIQLFQKDTKKSFALPLTLRNLVDANGLEGWKGPYIVLDANEKAFSADPTVDAWGSEFRFAHEDGAIVLTSPGSDKEFGVGTSDDLIFSNGQRKR